MSRFAPERLDPLAYPFTIELPVFFGDLDMNAHVNNVSMGRFFEHARVQAIRRELIPAQPERKLFVGRVAIDYLAQARIFRDLLVGTRLARVGTSSITVEQAAWQQGTPVALAEVVLVHVVDERSAPFPEEFRRDLATHITHP